MKASKVALLVVALLAGTFHVARPVLAGHGELVSGKAADLIVSPDGPFTTIQAALQAAGEGDVIRVQPGVYAGPLVVDKSVTLQGDGDPVIDGGEEGTVVTLAAPEITFKGFTVRGSGVEPDRDHAGISVTAADITVADNRLVDVLFGIFVAEADRAVLRGNNITSKPQYDQGRKGDAIRVWYSQDVTVEANHVHEARDVVIWYSRNIILRNNRIEKGRYGVHLMYCDGAQILGNQVMNNSVGAYVMYSNDVNLQENDIRGQHGSSGYGLGFKDADNVRVFKNLLVDNHAGVFLDGTPYTPQGFAHITENVFAYNNIAVSLMPAVQRAEFTQNTFWENSEQMAIQGGGQGQNTWSGNYWSDYSGFDGDGDGIGDIPYHAERLFENLTDREPLLRMLIYSPAVQAVEMAAAAFPIFQPQPKLSDAAPSMRAAILSAETTGEGTNRTQLILAAAAILAAGLGLGLVGLGLPRKPGAALQSKSTLEGSPWKAK
jgi:nitrous oxidase accessory protein